jgi:hypothetical protein
MSNHGCPDEDSDGDGVLDRYDKCKDVSGRPSFDGCPLPDRDGDAIADNIDRCPDRPERWNGRRDGDGCPDRGRALITISNGTIRIPRRVRFKAGRVSPGSVAALRLAGSALRKAKVTSVTIEVVAPYGLSYGHSVMRARTRGRLVRAELARYARIPPKLVRVRARGPDGKPRVEIRYR